LLPLAAADFRCRLLLAAYCLLPLLLLTSAATPAAAVSVASESKAGAGALPSGSLSSAPAHRLPEFAPDREILGIYARTFQFMSVASRRDARKRPS
jgi:hypothetical protein